MIRVRPPCRLGAGKNVDSTSVEENDPHLNKVTYWLWVVTRNAWGRETGGWAVLDTLTKMVKSLAILNSALTMPYRYFERPDPINRLFMSSPSSHMNVLIVFLKLISWWTNIQPYFIIKILESDGWGSNVLRLQYLKSYNIKWNC